MQPLPPGLQLQALPSPAEPPAPAPSKPVQAPAESNEGSSAPPTTGEAFLVFLRGRGLLVWLDGGTPRAISCFGGGALTLEDQALLRQHREAIVTAIQEQGPGDDCYSPSFLARLDEEQLQAECAYLAGQVLAWRGQLPQHQALHATARVQLLAVKRELRRRRAPA